MLHQHHFSLALYNQCSKKKETNNNKNLEGNELMNSVLSYTTYSQNFVLRHHIEISQKLLRSKRFKGSLLSFKPLFYQLQRAQLLAANSHGTLSTSYSLMLL